MGSQSLRRGPLQRFRWSGVVESCQSGQTQLRRGGIPGAMEKARGRLPGTNHTEGRPAKSQHRLLYGQHTGLSPVAIVVSSLFWTILWGPIGLLLATPLTVCLVVLGKHIEALQIIDVLLGDEPALEPEERFYQRVLAGDATEAADQPTMTWWR
jgi:hypothetical protein